MDKKSKVLIIGATGRIGYHLARFSIEYSHPTFALIRESSVSDRNRQHKIQSLSSAGVILLKGSLEDEESLIEAVKQVDIVICAIPSKQVLDQKHLIRVIKNAGCIKRFIPSEFGADSDKTQISDLDNNFYSQRTEIRRLIEAEGIPYTYICCNMFMSYFLPSLVQPGLKTPPRHKVTIFGDGNVKGVFMKEIDVAAFTISALDDPRTLNKLLYLRPPGNVYSMNELVEIWESKIETPYPDNMEMIFIYSIFVKGDHTYFDIESSGGVDGTQLYSHLKYTTISEFLDTML